MLLVRSFERRVSQQTIAKSFQFYRKFLLLEHFKDFHFNAPHPRYSKTGIS